jgi:uncharacterized protein (TIGR00369 family)
MSGLQWLQSMKNGDVPPPPVVNAMGMRLDEVDHGRVHFSMDAQAWMCNPSGTVHGGMVATLLDTVLTLAIVSKLPDGKSCTTVQLNINYVRPLFPSGEPVRAEGVALHVGTTIGTSEARAYDHRGKMIAHATSTIAIMDDAALTRSPAAP